MDTKQFCMVYISHEAQPVASGLQAKVNEGGGYQEFKD